MNHMTEVAHMLGLELNENFRFKSRLIDLSTYEFKFTEDYLMYYHTEGDYWNKASFDTLCNLLNGKYEVIKLPKPVLDDVEKEYLSYVIKPFRNSVKYFYKFTCANGDYEAIVAKIEAYGYCDSLNFPKFKKGSMYTGMELIKEYSLEELGL